MRITLPFRLHSPLRQRSALFALLALCQIVLYFVFRDQISQMNEPKLEFKPNSLEMLPLGIALTAAYAWILPLQIDRFASISIWIIYLLLVMPACVMVYSLGFEHVLPDFALSIALPVAVMGLVWSSPSRFTRTVQSRPLGRFGDLVAGASTLAIGLYLFLHLRDSLSLDVLDVYTRRFEQRSLARSADAYVIATYFGAVLVLALARGLHHGRHWLTALALMGFLLVFSIDGSKTALFIPLVMCAAHAAMKVGAFSALHLASAVLLIFCASYAIDDYNLHLYGLRRMICYPMLTVFAYFEHFSATGYLRGQDISFVSELAYGREPMLGAAYQIGAAYFDNPRMNVTTNIMSVGFAEAGVLGAWLMAFLAFVVLALFGLGLSRTPAEFGVMLAIPIAMRFCEQGLHTAMLSGGVFLLLLLVLAGHVFTGGTRNALVSSARPPQPSRYPLDLHPQ